MNRERINCSHTTEVNQNLPEQTDIKSGGTMENQPAKSNSDECLSGACTILWKPQLKIMAYPEMF